MFGNSCKYFNPFQFFFLKKRLRGLLGKENALNGSGKKHFWNFCYRKLVRGYNSDFIKSFEALYHSSRYFWILRLWGTVAYRELCQKVGLTKRIYIFFATYFHGLLSPCRMVFMMMKTDKFDEFTTPENCLHPLVCGYWRGKKYNN